MSEKTPTVRMTDIPSPTEYTYVNHDLLLDHH
jgi:hypothetical protein